MLPYIDKPCLALASLVILRYLLCALFPYCVHSKAYNKYRNMTRDARAKKGLTMKGKTFMLDLLTTLPSGGYLQMGIGRASEKQKIGHVMASFVTSCNLEAGSHWLPICWRACTLDS